MRSIDVLQSLLCILFSASNFDQKECETDHGDREQAVFNARVYALRTSISVQVLALK